MAAFVAKYNAVRYNTAQYNESGAIVSISQVQAQVSLDFSVVRVPNKVVTY